MFVIPELGPNGLLPPGRHQADDWVEVARRFGSTERRGSLLTGLLACLQDLRRAGCSTAFLNGSFVTAKPDPDDFDVAYDPTDVDIEKLDPVLRMVNPPRVAQKTKYGGDILPDSAGGMAGVFVAFFQGTRDGGRKGIVVIDLRTLP